MSNVSMHDDIGGLRVRKPKKERRKKKNNERKIVHASCCGYVYIILLPIYGVCGVRQNVNARGEEGLGGGGGCVGGGNVKVTVQVQV
jgi:hypothetical protein